MKGIIYLLLIATCSTGSVKQSYVAHVFVDSVHVIDYYVKAGKISKEVFFDQSKKLNEQIQYVYNDSGELSSIDFSGDAAVSGMNKDLALKLYNDAKAQTKILDRLKMNIPLQKINSSELRDITYLLSSTDIMKDTSFDSRRLIIVENIDKAFRFNASDLEGLITSTNVVNKYTVELKDSIVLKEQIFFDEGLLERTYSWNGSKELNIKIECKFNNSEQVTSVKKILIEDL